MMEMDSTPPSQQLTSTTAPGKIFASRADVAAHYKSDYHKYNLKRREGGLPYLLEADFQARLEAAKALRQEKQVGTDHLKKGVNRSDKKDKKKQAEDKISEQQDPEEADASKANQDTDMPTENAEGEPTPEQVAEEETIDIEPRQSLFDKHLSESVSANINRMQRKYGFFAPDREYLTDLEGLLGYCHEKIKLGHMCLYCQRTFTTYQGCQNHMISKQHCKIRYEPKVDLEDFAVFYDFSEADAAFMSRKKARAATAESEGDSMVIVDTPEGEEVEGDQEWEDVSDDEMEVEEPADTDDNREDDEGIYAGYQDEVARMGFDVTPLGELIFPDGRIVGHRLFKRYYKQRSTQTTDSAPVAAARSAAGERVYRGQVYNTSHAPTEENALALAHYGIGPGKGAGRSGKGILVSSGPGGSFTQLSVYRYRAAMRKERKGERKGQKLFEHNTLNMNQMDKKANRLFNNVSVAHTLR
jgi:pre-60S factor REI1